MFTDMVAKQVAQDLFGCYGIATRMPGECDHNFHILTDEGKEFLLKISHAQEQKSIIEMQNEVLHAFQTENPPFHYPILQPTLSGEWVGKLEVSEGQTNLVRLFTFVQGELFANSRPHTEKLLEGLGNKLGHLSRSLRNFKHPAASRYLKWDLKQALWIKEHLKTIDNHEDRQLVALCITKFASETAPVLSNLRQSAIHGDVNDYNVVVSHDREKKQVSGFIDFGDLVESSTICELAIALTYAIMDNPAPLDAASLIIKEYHAVFPLEEMEINLLFDLIVIRLCTSVVNSAVRKKENPHDPYLVISEKPAWNLLKILQSVDSQEVSKMFRAVCGLDQGKTQ